jgi:hypothetical protein
MYPVFNRIWTSRATFGRPGSSVVRLFSLGSAPLGNYVDFDSANNRVFVGPSPSCHQRNPKQIRAR